MHQVHLPPLSSKVSSVPQRTSRLPHLHTTHHNPLTLALAYPCPSARKSLIHQLTSTTRALINATKDAHNLGLGSIAVERGLPD